MSDTENKQNKAVSAVIFIVVCAILIAFDQLTKRLAVSGLKNGRFIDIVKGVFGLEYVENRGAAWGMMSGARIFFVVIALVLCVVIFLLYLRIPKGKRYLPLRILSVLLFSGAVGNLIDRLLNGYVVDFLSFYLIHFPVFNVADCYVTVSVILLAIFLLFFYKDEELAAIWKKPGSGDPS